MRISTGHTLCDGDVKAGQPAGREAIHKHAWIYTFWDEKTHGVGDMRLRPQFDTVMVVRYTFSSRFYMAALSD